MAYTGFWKHHRGCKMRKLFTATWKNVQICFHVGRILQFVLIHHAMFFSQTTCTLHPAAPFRFHEGGAYGGPRRRIYRVFWKFSLWIQMWSLGAGGMLWWRQHLIYTIWKPQLLFSNTGDYSLQSHGLCKPIVSTYSTHSCSSVQCQCWICAALEGSCIVSQGSLMEKGRKINRVVVPVFIHGGVQLLSFTPKYCEFSQCFSMRMCIMGAKLKTCLQCITMC